MSIFVSLPRIERGKRAVLHPWAAGALSKRLVSIIRLKEIAETIAGRDAERIDGRLIGHRTRADMPHAVAFRLLLPPEASWLMVDARLNPATWLAVIFAKAEKQAKTS